MQHRILYDNGKRLCLIGNTEMSRRIQSWLEAEGRKVDLILLEDLIAKSVDWINQRQYMLVTSDIQFRLAAVDALKNYDLNWFSAIGVNNVTHADLEIGRSVFIGSYNYFSSPGTVIADYTHISSHCMIGEQVRIEKYSHVSAYVFLNHCTLGQGCIIGLRSTVVNQVGVLQIPDWTNLMTGSVVSKPIETSGTYYGNKLVSTEDSRTNRIL
jgi:UDP-3-O-[3-hydroxymyristoyl] glucosamine N-acyltransferase